MMHRVVPRFIRATERNSHYPADPPARREPRACFFCFFLCLRAHARAIRGHARQSGRGRRDCWGRGEWLVVVVGVSERHWICVTSCKTQVFRSVISIFPHVRLIGRRHSLCLQKFRTNTPQPRLSDLLLMPPPFRLSLFAVDPVHYCCC